MYTWTFHKYDCPGIILLRRVAKFRCTSLYPHILVSSPSFHHLNLHIYLHLQPSIPILYIVPTYFHAANLDEPLLSSVEGMSSTATYCPRKNSWMYDVSQDAHNHNTGMSHTGIAHGSLSILEYWDTYWDPCTPLPLASEYLCMIRM